MASRDLHRPSLQHLLKALLGMASRKPHKGHSVVRLPSGGVITRIPRIQETEGVRIIAKVVMGYSRRGARYTGETWSKCSPRQNNIEIKTYSRSELPRDRAGTAHPAFAGTGPAIPTRCREAEITETRQVLQCATVQGLLQRHHRWNVFVLFP